MTLPRRPISFRRRHPRLSLAVALIAGAAATWLLQSLPREPVRLTLTPVVRAVLQDAGSPSAGSARPDVTVVVFTDYQCPICRVTDPALGHVLATDPTVRVVFKDWPIIGPASTEAAKAALAADRQGRYPAFHRALMSTRRKLDAGEIRRLAEAAGVDWPRLERDKATYAAEIDLQLRRHAFQAWSLGIEGTPAYIVGPFLYAGGLDRRRLAHAIRRARAAGPIRP